MPNDLNSLNRAEKVSPAGRILSGIAGILLTSGALSGKRRQPIKAILGGYLLFRGASGYCPVSQALNRPSGASAVEVLTSLTVNKPLDETYRFWRNLEGLPVFMKHLESVIELENKQSLWVAALPWKMGKLQWKAEITTEKINECIAWRALENADIAHHGSVHFKDAGKFGTEVRVHLHYAMPGGKPGELAGKLIRPGFETMVREDIKNFRRYMETGEIPTTQGQPSAT